MLRILIFSLMLQVSHAVAQNSRSLSIDSLLQSYAFHGRFTGTVMVSMNDQVIYHKTVDKEQTTSDEPVYGIMSLSKQFTAVAILKLAEQGKLKLDDCLVDYLPAFVPKKGRKITLHHLLSQSSGLIDNFARPTEDPNDVILPKAESIELDSLLRKLYVDDMRSKPGKHFDYSNLNYALLARVIEEVSGMSYADYMEKEIFAPANLTSTFSKKTSIPISRLAKAYEGQQQGAMLPCQPYHESWLTGAGSIFTTASDLVKWTNVLENNLILSNRSKELLLARHMRAGNNRYYGYGWMIEEQDQEKYVWHDGTYKGYASYLGWFPSTGLRVVLLTNHTNKLEELDQSEELVKELVEKLLAIVDGKSIVNLPLASPPKSRAVIKEQKFRLDDEHYFILHDRGDSIDVRAINWSLFEYPYLLSVVGDEASLHKTKKFCNSFVAGKYGKGKRLGTMGIRMFPAALYKGFWKGKTKDAGAFVDFNIFKLKKYEESVTYSIRFNYERKQFGLIVSVNNRNKIQGFFNHAIPEKKQQFLVSGIPVSGNGYFVDGFRYNTKDVLLRTLKNGNLSFCVGDQCYEADLIE